MKKLFTLFLLAGAFALTACEKKEEKPAETPATEEATPETPAQPADSNGSAVAPAE